MMKRLVLIFTCILCLASSSFAQPPNIIWILGDDYSAMNFGAYGNALVDTPTIDRLAAEGLVFDNAFVPNPICSPMRSSLITGMYPTSIDVHNHRSHGPSPKIPYQTGYTLPDPVAHVAELFQAGGYYTMVDDKGDYNFNMESIPWDTEDWDTAVQNQPFFAIRGIDKTSGADDEPINPNEVDVPPYYADEPEIRKILARTLNGISTVVDPTVAEFMADIESAGIAENTIVIFFSDHGKLGFRAKQWLYDTGLKVPLIVWSGGDSVPFTPGARVSDVVSTVDLAATSLSLAGLPVPGYMDGVPFLGPETQKRDYVAASRDRGDETFDRIRAIRTEDYKYIRNFYPELPYTQYNYYKFNSPELYGNLNIMMEMHEQGALDPVQDLFFQPVKPEEELYDVRADPWEINNLALDPSYAETLHEMRGHLSEWIEYKNPVTGWRDKGALPENATRTFIIEQDAPTSPYVTIVTTVDDIDGADLSLRVEYSLDDGANWFNAVLADNVSAEYGQPDVDNRREYQIGSITTRNAGANTVRLKWDTQSEANGAGPVGNILVEGLRIRTTPFDGTRERESHVSMGGFRRDFPRVVENTRPFSLDLTQVGKGSPAGGAKKYTIANTVNTFDRGKAEKTKTGYRYWFADKQLADGKTLKLSVVEPGAATHPPHQHAEDEFFFILEGTAELYLDGETTVRGPMTSFYCPSGSKHGIRNVGDTELKYLVIKNYILDDGVEGETADRFTALNAQQWEEVFFDTGTGDWREHWTLDGLKAEVSNSEAGMNFRAGPTPDDDASHAVLWTRQSFSGDLKIEYEYTRTDEANQYVNILYVQATGSGEESISRDISEWADERTVPAMSEYWGNMHTYHISYAAYGREPVTDDYDYIRARRYRPDVSPRKNGPIFKPDVCERSGMFAPGVPHQITVIKQGDELIFKAKNADREILCHWDTSGQPPINEGRIGLRHMYTRSARYRDFRVSVLEKNSE